MLQRLKSFRLSIGNMTAGFVAVMVGFTSSVVLVFQAAMAAGASPLEISSWLFALGFSIAACCFGLSFYYRMPILVGWSTPGAALLVTSLTGHSMPEAVGAFIFAALLTILSGVSGLFEKMMLYIPRALTAAMLAGILLHFGINIFVAMQHQVLLVGTMLLVYLLGKRLFPRSVIIWILLVGICLAKSQGLFQLDHLSITWTMPVFTKPEFSLSSLLSIGLPLFIVTMTSQNMPGLAVLDASGFKPPISPLMSWIGLSNAFFAPFGCYAIGLTALTAAICAGPEADPNPLQRYKSTLFAGCCWLGVGLLGSTLVTLFLAFPKELILTVAGLALLSTLANSLKGALDDEQQREPALITILVSASGISFWGIGAACWGLVAGIVSSFLLTRLNKSLYLPFFRWERS